ncbi:MAG: hypothetical protein H0T72_13085 [Chloroflexia bacterium]|nr:hypothetical protein [Chloroflexia bacterium]
MVLIVGASRPFHLFQFIPESVNQFQGDGWVIRTVRKQLDILPKVALSALRFGLKTSPREIPIASPMVIPRASARCLAASSTSSGIVSVVLNISRSIAINSLLQLAPGEVLLIRVR